MIPLMWYRVLPSELNFHGASTTACFVLFGENVDVTNLDTPIDINLSFFMGYFEEKISFFLTLKQEK